MNKITKNGISIYIVGMPPLLDEYDKMRWDLLDDDCYSIDIYMAIGFGQHEIEFGQKIHDMIDKIIYTKEFKDLCYKRLNAKSGKSFDTVFLEILMKQDAWKDLIVETIYRKNGTYSDPKYFPHVNWERYTYGLDDKNGEMIAIE
ncbi:MAG: hypothetical protein Q4F84_09495 [Fibrobacter sp.]|nr:hypothetical protein [Fibrobacter sp.]